MHQNEKLSIKYKWNFMVLLYLCLMIIFFTMIVSSNGIIRLTSFLVAGVLIVGCTRNLKNILFFFMALLPNTELLNESFMGISILRIIFVCCFIFIIKCIITRHEKKEMIVPMWFYAIWLVYIVLNQGINGDISIKGFVSIAGMMVISIALQEHTNYNSKSREKIILAVFTGFSFILFIAYLELAIGHTFFYSLWTGAERYRYGIMRVGSTVADPNNVCFYLVPFFFWMMTNAVKNVIPRYFRKVVHILTFVMILLTSSRTGMIALVLGLFLCIIGKRKARLLVALPVIGVAFNSLLNIFEKLMATHLESTNFRNYIVEQCLLLWNQNKIFGIGMGNIMKSLGYESGSLNTMNTYIFMLTGLGIIGLIFYIIYWLFMAKNDVYEWIKNKHIKADTLLKIACIFTTMLIAYSLDTFYMMLMWIMPAMLCATKEQTEIGEHK